MKVNCAPSAWIWATHRMRPVAGASAGLSAVPALDLDGLSALPAPGAGGRKEPFVELRVPKLFTLRGDPFERADYEGIGYDRWRIDHVFLLIPAQAFVTNRLQTFREFPPRQKPASFSLDRVMESMTHGPRAN
jgi:hypothetical protein